MLLPESVFPPVCWCYRWVSYPHCVTLGLPGWLERVPFNHPTRCSGPRVSLSKHQCWLARKGTRCLCITNSGLFEKSQADALLPSFPRLTRGVNVPLLLLAGPAYPLLPWLMTPYVQHGNLKRNDAATEDISTTILACSVLHNISVIKLLLVYFTTFVKYTRSNLMTPGWKSLYQV